MSAASTPNRRGAPGVLAGRRTPTTTSSTSAPPSRSPSTATTTSSGSSTIMNGLNRAQSKRGTPLPPRSAAAVGRKQSTTPDPAEEDAKAEMHAKMEHLQQKLQEAELAHQEAQKQAAVLQMKLDEALKEQGMLEERVQEHTERNEELENEKKDSLRARREMEQIYESEKVAANKEKEDAVAREEEMQQAMQRLKETLAQREIRAGVEDERRPFMSRQSSANARSGNPSPDRDRSDRQFAPASMSRSDSTSRSNSKLVMQKDKVIESLRLELADAEMKLIEVDHKGGGHLQDLQKQVYDLKMQNARLMEENESFQVMLTEKTIAGDFHLNLAPPSMAASRPPSRRQEDQAAGGQSLADELENHGDSEGEDGEQPKQLRAEINSLKDANKALTLYINNIISRLLQHDQFEAILDKTPDLMAGPGAASRRTDADKDLPPPPPPKDEQPSLLQRAKSVMGGKARPRPLSQTINTAEIDPPLQTPSLEPPRTEDPNTAPRVPIGRSNSKRGGSGHRRANSEWPAASLVSNMYRSGTPQTGPLSPPLGSPTGRNSFFGGNMRQLSSSSNVPTISETTDTAGKENAGPQRDSKMSEIRSNRNSIQSNIAGGGIEGLDYVQENGTAYERSTPSSPPRSTTSSGDKDGKGPSGAIMMGSKPRPLRLVQEAKDEDAARKQANRGSWFGFMNQGLKAPSGGAGGIFGQRSNSGDPPAQ